MASCHTHVTLCQSSHRIHRIHRSFWRKIFSHRFHRCSQIRRVWHSCHTHAALCQFSHGIRRTHRNDCRRIFSTRSFCVFRGFRGRTLRSLTICGICEICGRLFSARSFCVFRGFRGRTLRSLTICNHLCASVGGSSPPETSVGR